MLEWEFTLCRSSLLFNEWCLRYEDMIPAWNKFISLLHYILILDLNVVVLPSEVFVSGICFLHP